MELNKEEIIAKIVLTLKHGWFNGESKKKLIGVYIGLVCVFAFGIIIGVLMLSIEQVNSPNSSIGLLVLALIAIIFGFSLLPVILFFIIYKNEKVRKDVELWVEDAVEVNAYTKKIDTKYWLGIPLVKFLIEFDVDGVHYARTSDTEKQTRMDFGRPKGYFAYLTKYMGKNIKILYSPKYDEVMILKDKHN